MNKTSSAWIGPLSSGYEHSIEHIWDEIGCGLDELDPQSVNLMELGVVVQNLRQQIPLERVQTLVSSMPRRVRVLVDPRGSSTQY